MAYVIGSDCVSCGACAGVCPVGAISQGSEHYEIDAGSCIECGSCAYICPARIPLVQSFKNAKVQVRTASAKKN
jgi:ferredoxin